MKIFGVEQLVDQEEFHDKYLFDGSKKNTKPLEQSDKNLSSLLDKQQIWNNLIKLTTDKDYLVSSKAADALISAFSQVPDKQQAWKQLIKLTNDNEYLRYKAIKTLISVFPSVPDKQQAWNDLRTLITNEKRSVRLGAADILSSLFFDVLDKQQAFQDLRRLINDEDRSVRLRAANSLVSAFSQVPNKQMTWRYLTKLINDKDNYGMPSTSSVLISAFSQVPDKQQAWKYLIRLTNDEDWDVRYRAANTLISVFPHVPYKQQAWNDLVKLTNDKDGHVCSKAIDALASAFSQVPDKQQAWNDLITLIEEGDWNVRLGISVTLVFAYPQLPDKHQAWNDLIRLSDDKDWNVRSAIAGFLVSAFSHVPEKQQAWKDLIKLIKSGNNDVIIKVASALNFAYPQVPHKQQAWNDLMRLTNRENDSDVRFRAVSVLINAFSLVPDKQQAWNNLIRFTTDKDWNISFSAASALDYAFYHMPDKIHAWKDLHRLTKGGEGCIKSGAIIALGSSFSQVPNREEAWSDLHRLTNDQDNVARYGAATSLGLAFPHLPNKQQAWEDLQRLTTDQDSVVRSGAASSLGLAFPYVPDKQLAWNELHNLTNDEDLNVRYDAVYSLGLAFPYVPDKQLVWNELHRLISGENSDIRYVAASLIGSNFFHIPDKQQAWIDLITLTGDGNLNVRIHANHSLGKVSIFQASQAEKEEEYEKKLMEAIAFFEKATQESKYFNPSQFCLPFYRSLYSILFRKQAKEEVDKYLAEAKNAIKGSESKELLLEVIENFTNALKEGQNLENLNLKGKKDELNFYRQLCEQVEELMKSTDKTAPLATAAMRKMLTLLYSKIKEKAKTACRESRGTVAEEIAYDICMEVQKWEIDNQEEMTLYVENFTSSLESKIPQIPENEHIFMMINESKNQKDLKKLFENMSELIGIIPEIIIDLKRMKPTIGIITALPKEYVAVSVLLENRNDKYKIPGPGAGRRYCLGEILSEKGDKYNLVLANAGMGNNIAATRASILLEHFPNVKSIIMVGIAGGVPNPKKAEDHVRLGDIVVSSENGVIQYDIIKQEIKEITHRNPPRPPSASLLDAVRYLEGEEILGNRPWEKYIVKALSKFRAFRPFEDKDVLYISDHQKRKIKHPEDLKRIKGQPRVFIGPIASANILQKDPKARDKLREKFGVKAIEMEASGIADATWNHEVGYLVVRGICDYCDSHKNDDWQQYAAVVAAAYTRALIESMP